MSSAKFEPTPEIKKAISAFYKSTGIPCFCIDSSGRRIAAEPFDPAPESFCSHCAMHANAECDKVCLYGRYQAERFGGKYIFFCPSGLTYCVSPIISDLSEASALFSGPMLMMEPEEFLLEEFLHPHHKGLVSEDARDLARKLPVVQPERVDSISELLYLIADSLSVHGLRQYDKVRLILESNANVSVSIHALKGQLKSGSQPLYPLEKERELHSKISLGDKKGAQEVLNDILGYVFFSTGRDFEIIKARSMELIVTLSRGAIEGGADIEEIFGLNHRYLNDIRDLKSIDELTGWLSKILERFTDCVFNLTEIRHKDVIFQAVNYIRRNYASHISLDDVAKQVHLNSSYLSRVFKEEMHTNFVSYINNMRIETAKKLLLDSSVPLLEVAGLVGFDEQSYFTRVFKKTTGITPGKFRESRGLNTLRRPDYHSKNIASI